MNSSQVFVAKLFGYFSGNIKMWNVNYCLQNTNILTYLVVFIKKIKLLQNCQGCFPGKFMNLSDKATGGVLWKKLFLKNLLKRDSNTGVLFWILQNF